MKRETIAALLPDVMRRADCPGTPLRALLEVVEGCLDPVDRTLDAVHAAFDPRRTRDRFVGMLAAWLDVADLTVEVHTAREGRLQTLPSGHGRLRELVASAAELARWRGTARGLERFLTVATGCTGFTIEEPDEAPFRLRVRAPHAARPHAALVERIVAREKPAFVQCTVEFASPGEPPPGTESIP